MVRGDGSLDRKALAELAFQHNQADKLNHIVHPAVIAAEEEWMRDVFAADPKRVAIVESALIFEVEKWGTAPGWVQRFDRTHSGHRARRGEDCSFCCAHDGQRRASESRLEAITQDARARMATQIPDQEKAGRVRVCDRQFGFSDMLERSTRREGRGDTRLNRGALCVHGTAAATVRTEMI